MKKVCDPGSHVATSWLPRGYLYLATALRKMWLLLIACIPCNSSPEAADVVSALNARFRAGTPSDDPASAGVVIHALNPQLGLGELPWESRASSQIVSCSIINAQLPFLWHGEGSGIGGAFGFGGGQLPGLVLSSSAVKRALLCSYPDDGCTNGRLCPADWRSSDVCPAAHPRLTKMYHEQSAP